MPDCRGCYNYINKDRPECTMLWVVPNSKRQVKAEKKRSINCKDDALISCLNVGLVKRCRSNIVYDPEAASIVLRSHDLILALLSAAAAPADYLLPSGLRS